MPGFSATTLDPEGRVIVKRPMRERMGVGEGEGTVVISFEGDRLTMRSEEAWEKHIAWLKCHTSGEEQRESIRHYEYFAASTKLDRQGRARVPDYLLEDIGIRRSGKGEKERDIVLAATGDRVDLWSPSGWDRVLAKKSSMRKGLIDITDRGEAAERGGDGD